MARTRRKPTASTTSAPTQTRTRSPRIQVTECDDLTDTERGAYGHLYVAKVGDFTSAQRSTPERARAEAEAHLAAKDAGA